MIMKNCKFGILALGIAVSVFDGAVAEAPASSPTSKNEPTSPAIINHQVLGSSVPVGAASVQVTWFSRGFGDARVCYSRRDGLSQSDISCKTFAIEAEDRMVSASASVQGGQAAFTLHVGGKTPAVNGPKDTIAVCSILASAAGFNGDVSCKRSVIG